MYMYVCDYMQISPCFVCVYIYVCIYPEIYYIVKWPGKLQVSKLNTSGTVTNSAMRSWQTVTGPNG